MINRSLEEPESKHAKLIAQVNDAWVSNVNISPTGKCDVTLSQNRESAMFLEGKEIKAVYEVFGAIVEYIRVERVETDITDIILRQMR